MARMDTERYGLPLFRQYGMPATVFFQGVDLLVKPWLAMEMQSAGSIEWGNAPFSHTLLPIQNALWQEEVRRRLGTVPVTFFGEFYVPRPEQIPTPFTLVLEGSSVLMRECEGDFSLMPYPEHVHSIRFGGRVGILLRKQWFGGFLGKFFEFQRYPILGSHPDGIDCLEELLDEIERIAADNHDRVVVVPLDLEAPWIGSFFGTDVWRIFFEGLVRRGLLHVFVPLSSALEQFATEAIPVNARPHRELGKWYRWGHQLEHAFILRQHLPENDERANVHMIATGSDIFAAWGNKAVGLWPHERAVLNSVDMFGRPSTIPVGYNQDVIDVQLAASDAIINRTSFQEALDRRISQVSGHLFRLVANTANRLQL